MMFMEKKKSLECSGEWDYDYADDTLFFKAKDRTYAKSIDMDRFVVDVDDENFIVGIQIFEASEFFNIPKDSIRNVRKWRFQASVDENRLEVRLFFQTMYRNKLIEPMPIIMEPLKQSLPNSKLVCTA